MTIPCVIIVRHLFAFSPLAREGASHHTSQRARRGRSAFGHLTRVAAWSAAGGETSAMGGGAPDPEGKASAKRKRIDALDRRLAGGKILRRSRLGFETRRLVPRARRRPPVLRLPTRRARPSRGRPRRAGRDPGVEAASRGRSLASRTFVRPRRVRRADRRAVVRAPRAAGRVRRGARGLDSGRAHRFGDARGDCRGMPPGEDGVRRADAGRAGRDEREDGCGRRRCRARQDAGPALLLEPPPPPAAAARVGAGAPQKNARNRPREWRGTPRARGFASAARAARFLRSPSPTPTRAARIVRRTSRVWILCGAHSRRFSRVWLNRPRPRRRRRRTTPRALE